MVSQAGDVLGLGRQWREVGGVKIYCAHRVDQTC